MKPALILASTSLYRRELLQRLRVPFEVIAPGVDETAGPNETPTALAPRLARAKAAAVANIHRQAWVIGSDQVADLGGLALGKPGNHARATEQLRQMRGREVVFHTAVCVARACTAHESVEMASVRVQFRQLSDDDIETYLRAEQPYDCAGSAKSESLGIALLDRIDNDDPTALVGLPLIRTVRMLRRAGYDVLRPPESVAAHA